MTPSGAGRSRLHLRTGRRQRTGRRRLTLAPPMRSRRKSDTSSAQRRLNCGSAIPTRLANYLNRAAAIDANHYRLHAIGRCWRRKRTARPMPSPNTKPPSRRMPAGGVPEGQLYPIQLRLNLAELYRESGDDQAAHQQTGDRRSRRSTNSMCRARRKPSSCGFALP